MPFRGCSHNFDILLWVITVQMKRATQSCYENGDPPCNVTIERSIDPSDDEAYASVQQSIIVATADSKDDCVYS